MEKQWVVSSLGKVINSFEDFIVSTNIFDPIKTNGVFKVPNKWANYLQILEMLDRFLVSKNCKLNGYLIK